MLRTSHNLEFHVQWIWLVGWVLWDIRPCTLFNIKSSLYIGGAYDKFPDFFHMGTFIDSTHMKL